jgi:hypothetical protein
MDVSDASYYINPKITKIKVAKWGTPKKSLKKKKKYYVSIADKNKEYYY